MAAWNLWLSQVQYVFDTFSAQILTRPNHQGKPERRVESFSCLGKQNMDTSGFQAADMEDKGFQRENTDVKVDKVFQPGLDTHFSCSAFNIFETRSMAENMILIDEMQNKENSPPPTSPTSGKPTCRSFRTRIEKVPNYV